MRTFAAVGLLVTLFTSAAPAQDAPKIPSPQKEHAWLGQLEGEWETEAELTMAPGRPPEKARGTESVRTLGGFWAVSEMKTVCMGVPMTGVMTLGYDAKAGKYVGTWVCSACDQMCKYEGTLGTSGRVLTLDTEGPHPATGKTVKMRDVIEVKGKDRRVMTSLLRGGDGEWVTFMTLTATRKK